MNKAKIDAFKKAIVDQELDDVVRARKRGNALLTLVQLAGEALPEETRLSLDGILLPPMRQDEFQNVCAALGISYKVFKYEKVTKDPYFLAFYEKAGPLIVVSAPIDGAYQLEMEGV